MLWPLCGSMFELANINKSLGESDTACAASWCHHLSNTPFTDRDEDHMETVAFLESALKVITSAAASGDDGSVRILGKRVDFRLLATTAAGFGSLLAAITRVGFS